MTADEAGRELERVDQLAEQLRVLKSLERWIRHEMAFTCSRMSHAIAELEALVPFDSEHRTALRFEALDAMRDRVIVIYSDAAAEWDRLTDGQEWAS